VVLKIDLSNSYEEKKNCIFNLKEDGWKGKKERERKQIDGERNKLFGWRDALRRIRKMEKFIIFFGTTFWFQVYT
jgi:hypothetical protein